MRGQADYHDSPLEVGPLACAAAVVVAGTAAGLWLVYPGGWLALAALCLAGAGALCWRRLHRQGWHWTLLGLLFAAAGWASLDQLPAGDDVARLIQPRPTIAQVVGVLEEPAELSPGQRGAFARFGYDNPATRTLLAVEAVRVGEAFKPASGRLLVKVGEAAPNLRQGARVRMTGWLSGFTGPANPGEFDYRALMRHQRIGGRLWLAEAGNCVELDPPGAGSWLSRFRQALAARASHSLTVGLFHEGPRLALLEALLLGQRGGDLESLDLAFRRVGLAHLLSISGAHLGILMGIIYLLARLLIDKPRRVAAVVLICLALYMLAVPWRVPIVRAGVMAGLFAIGYAGGRQVRAVDVLCLAVIVVLIWRPGDLASPGMQLSFGVVAALLVWTRPLAEWLWPAQRVEIERWQWHERLPRVGLEYACANVIAFVVAMPIVASHYGLISPLSAMLSLMALPVVTVVLGLGYLKIVVGLILPSAGLVLAGPTAWAADTLADLVQRASTWPGAAVELAQPPGPAWAVGAVAVAAAWLAGAFVYRRLALVTACGLLGGWLLIASSPRGVAALPGVGRAQPALRINVFSVRDGSCLLLRSYPEDGGRPHTVMFDCGSQSFLDVGESTVRPALRALGVRKLDALIVSHADLDHFCGVLDVVDGIEVTRVLTTPQLLDEARRVERGAAAALIEGLRTRGVPVGPITRGWADDWQGVDVQAIWPTAAFDPPRANAASAVLRLKVAGRRVMLWGDAQDGALAHLFQMEEDLRADIAELPHHGAWTAGSPRWIEAVLPKVVLQSCHERRLENDDPWPPLLARHGTTRLATPTHGMVELDVMRSGQVRWHSFHGLAGALPAPGGAASRASTGYPAPSDPAP